MRIGSTFLLILATLLFVGTFFYGVTNPASEVQAPLAAFTGMIGALAFLSEKTAPTKKKTPTFAPKPIHVTESCKHSKSPVPVIIAEKLVEAGMVKKEIACWLCPDCREKVSAPKAKPVPPKGPAGVAKAKQRTTRLVDGLHWKKPQGKVFPYDFLEDKSQQGIRARRVWRELTPRQRQVLMTRAKPIRRKKQWGTGSSVR